MAKMQRKSRSDSPMTEQPSQVQSQAVPPTTGKTLVKRVVGFLMDWAILYYFLHAAMYLHLVYVGSYTIEGWNYFKGDPYAAFFNPLKLEPALWAAAFGGTLVLAILLRSLGRSLGQRAFGMKLQSPQDISAGLGTRVLRIAVLPFSIVLSPLLYMGSVVAGRRDRFRPLHDMISGVSVRKYVHPTGLPRKRLVTTQWGVITLLLLALTLFLGWIMIKADLGALFGRADEAGRVFKDLFSPNFEHLTKADPVFYQRQYPQMFSIVNLMVLTVLMALAATLLGGLVAFPLSFLGARNIMCQSKPGWIVYSIVRGFFNIFRSIETLIWVVVFAVWIGYGNPFAGVMALVIHTIAALGKLYSEQVESIDPGPIEAILASGGSRLQVIRYAVIPQIIPSFLAFTLYRWDINVRMATIIALVGGGGIGDLLFFYRNELDWSQVGAVIAVMVPVVWTLDYISGRVRERIV